MRKVIISSIILGFIIAISFIAFMGYKFYKDFKSTKSPAELTAEVYYKYHHKEINKSFVVDKIEYKITGFNYYPKKDTTLLFVDIVIENKINRTQKYIDSFFVLKDVTHKTYYPTVEQFYLPKNNVQQLKLQYILPERSLPYLKYDLHINSKTDTAQNGMIILFKSYSATG
jgi:hypothetical protein